MAFGKNDASSVSPRQITDTAGAPLSPICYRHICSGSCAMLHDLRLWRAARPVSQQGMPTAVPGRSRRFGVGMLRLG